MAGKTLQVIESAYRGTLEEQDDTVVWLTHAMKGAGGEFDVVLRGNAVNYGTKGQDASGLAFGKKRQTQPPRIADDLAALIRKGVRIHVVEEDLRARGLERTNLIDGLEPVSADRLPELLARYDRVWHW